MVVRGLIRSAYIPIPHSFSCSPPKRRRPETLHRRSSCTAATTARCLWRPRCCCIGRFGRCPCRSRCMCSSTAVTASGWRPRILCFRRGPRCVSPGCGGAGSSRRVEKALRGRAAESCHSPLEIPESISWVLCEVRIERELRPGDRKTHTEILEIAASCRLGIVRGDARLEVAGLQRVATDLVEPALAFMRHLPVALLVDRVAHRKLIHRFTL